MAGQTRGGDDRVPTRVVRSCGHQGEAEGRWAELDEFEPSAVGLGEAACERQATPVCCLVVLGPIEQRGGSLGADARALVLDTDAVVLDQDRHGAAAVTERVVQEDREDLADEPWRRDHGVDPARRDDDLPSFLREPMLPIGDLVVDECRQVELLAFLGRAGPGDREQIVECQVEFVCLRQCRRCFLRHGGVRAALEQFEPHCDAGQAGAQLMSRVGGEAAFGLQHAVDPVGAQPQRPRDVVDLADPRRWGCGRAEVATTEP